METELSDVAEPSPGVEEPAERPAPQKYAIRRADLDKDREAIIGLWDRNMPAQWSNAERFDHFYRNGVFGPGRAWLLVTDPGDEIVGIAGLVMSRVRWGDTLLSVGAGSDFCVDANHRSLFPAIRLQKALLTSVKEDLDFAYSLPNEKSHGVAHRSGWRDVGRMDRWSRILRSRGSIEKRPVVGKLAPVLAPLADLVLRLKGPERRFKLGGRKIVPVACCDERFDDLWERASKHLAFAVERSSAFLRWRYNECGRSPYVVLALTTEDGKRVDGYAVYYMTGDRAICVDFLAADFTEALPLLLAGLVRRARGEGAASITLRMSGPEPVRQQLSRLGFVNRDSDEGGLPVIGAYRSGDRLDAEASVLKDWYMQLGDKDRE